MANNQSKGELVETQVKCWECDGYGCYGSQTGVADIHCEPCTICDGTGFVTEFRNVKKFDVWTKPPLKGVWAKHEEATHVVCTWDELCEANSDDQEVIEFSGKLDVGESETFGGGAAPLVYVRRIA